MAQTSTRPAETASGGLPRNVVVLGLVSFFADLSSEIVYPLIPIFLTTVLGAPATVVGLTVWAIMLRLRRDHERDARAQVQA